MDIIASFATDATLETEGKWFPLSKTAKVLVARSGNDRYIAALQAKMKEAQLDLASGPEANELAEVVLVDTLAETVLLGWDGITEGGKPVTYSVETARKYLRLKDFRRRIVAFSEDFEAFRLKAEEAQGND